LRNYLDLLQNILDNGETKSDRTGVDTKSIFGTTLRFSIYEGFPIITTRQMPVLSILSELLWFISGSSNINDLKKIYAKNKFWDGNYADYIKRNNYEDDGDCGKLYGKQWRKWEFIEKEEANFVETEIYKHEIDQLQNVIDTIKKNPNDRRILVTAWNPAEVSSDKCALPPCHVLIQLYCSKMNNFDKLIYLNNNSPVLYDDIMKVLKIDVESSTGMFEESTKLDQILSKIEIPELKLSLQWYQRSVDSFLGLCSNISSYAFLLSILAKLTNTVPHELIFVGGDTHIYLNHIDIVKEQLQRIPYQIPKSKLKIKDRGQTKLEDFVMTDFELENYQFHPKLTAEMAV